MKKIKKILKFFFHSIYHIIFRNKILIDELKNNNSILKYQLEYMKHHFDITQMKPATGWLREYQLKELDFANELITLFNSYEIKPFFDAGSLLGAIRHKGFIPFDDDIDIGLIRSDFEKLIEIAKKQFVWINTEEEFKISIFELCDIAISQHKNEYVFIRTPFCIHVYKGTSLRDSLNCEFFPFDYVNENVSEDEFSEFIKQYKKTFTINQPWSLVFNSYKKLLEEETVFSKAETSIITPGPGHYAFTQYNFLGFRRKEDLFPLSSLIFEGMSVPVPHNPENFIEKNYSSWKDFPKDVGISHSLEVLNGYFESKGQAIPYKEIY